MRVLVTGGAGFIGSHVCAALLERGHGVTVVDDLSRGFRELVPEGARLIEGSLADPRLEEWVRGHDAVIHMAGFIEVARSVEEPVLFAENNVVNSVRLLEAMRRAGVPKIVFSSSACVYGTPRRLPIREDDPLGAQSSPYGASKVAIETFVTTYHYLHGMDAVILRYFNPYGPGELHDPETHAIPNFIRATLEGKPVPLYWNGEHVRDFIYVGDLARAHVEVLGRSGLDVFNVGSETGVRVRDVLELVFELCGRRAPVQDLGARPGDVPATYASSEKLMRLTNWRPQVDLREGLRRTIAYYRERLGLA
ncbi:MAG TPA: NAD-dependent epimerase/dehydratase family protein [Dehalococcoidia bacterium]|nr:NAD-dependent epimerase/dehydratase family protein [Dehalococcoidia bacterium]